MVLATPLFSKPVTLINTATYLLEQIPKTESEADCVCWSTVRQMENFYSGKVLEPHAVLLKIKVMKSLLLSIWYQASQSSSQAVLDHVDIDQVVPLTLQEKLLKWPVENFFDDDLQKPIALSQYHKVTEHYRALLSIIFDEGLKRSYGLSLKPLDPSAIDRLSEFSTWITIQLLEDAVVIADVNRHQRVQLDDLKKAFSNFISTYSMPLNSVPMGPFEFNEKEMDTFKSLSLIIMKNKIKALKYKNRKIWRSDKKQVSIYDLVNSLISVPLTKEAYNALMLQLRVVTEFLAFGYHPQRIDTSINLSFKKNLLKKSSYVSVDSISNDFNQIFPVTYKPNGDVELFRVSNPINDITGHVLDKMNRTEGSPQKNDLLSQLLTINKDERATAHPKKISLTNYFLDSVRDTTIHWQMMVDVSQNDEAVVLDPFAVELISERISELIGYSLKEAEEVAQKKGKSEIDENIVGEALATRWQFVLKNRTESVWSDHVDSVEKETVLSKYKRPYFKDITAQTGIPNLMYHHIKTGSYYGSGVAIGDYDQDGLVDVFLPGDYGDRLYRNKGGFQFEDVTEAVHLPAFNLSYSKHALFVDVNNDGLLDLFILRELSDPKLFIQSKDHLFIDRSKESGLHTLPYSVCAVFFDYDLDGLLDVYIGHYQGLNEPVPLDGANAMSNLIFRNMGSGRFQLIDKEKSRSFKSLFSTAWTLAGVSFDMEQDGDMDIFLANDFGEDQLFENQSGLGFDSVGPYYGVSDRGSGMNASVVDVNYDGLWDIYVTMIDMFNKNVSFVLPKSDTSISLTDQILKTSSYLSGNKLFVNQGTPFKEKPSFVSMESYYVEPVSMGWGWGASFFDYDNDGDEDLYVTNGFKEETLASNQLNRFFIRQGDHYYHVDNGSDETFKSNSRSVVAVDFTNSGKMDLLITNFKKPIRILQNISDSTNYWVKIGLKGVVNNRYGVGASVRVYVEGKPTQMKLVSSGSGYLSQEDLTLTFGLKETDHVDRIEVIWPGNHRQWIEGPIAGNQKIEIVEEW